MMKRIVGWFVLVPLCALLIVFALANRHLVTVGIDPVSPDNPLLPALVMPQFVLIFGMLIIGVILGGVATWFAQGRVRRERRHHKRDAERLSRELADARRAPRQNPAQRQLLDPDDFLENE